MYGFIWTLIAAVVFLTLPLWALYEIIKGFRRKTSPSGEAVEGKQLGESDFMRALLLILVVVTGLASLYSLPEEGFGLTNEATVFGLRIALSTAVVLVGYKLSGLLGKVLMAIGVVVLVFSMPYVFENFGDTGAFIAVLLAFAALVYTTVALNKKKGRDE